MAVVYIDEIFLQNALVDYLLLLCSARLAGEPLRRGRFVLGAALGGAYAAAVWLPQTAFLAHPLCRLAAAVGMALAAYGDRRRLARAGMVFFAVSAAFAGGVLALRRLGAIPAAPDWKSTLLGAAVCYALLSLPLRRVARHTGRELARCRLRLGDRTCQLTALVDTGNTLTDPATGKPVMVAEGEKLAELFAPEGRPMEEELSDPVGALERREGDGRWRLLPYRSVGVPWGLLLAVRVDQAQVGREDYGPILVALSPGPVSDGGGYAALIGG